MLCVLLNKREILDWLAVKKVAIALLALKAVEVIILSKEESKTKELTNYKASFTDGFWLRSE